MAFGSEWPFILTQKQKITKSQLIFFYNLFNLNVYYELDLT